MWARKTVLSLSVCFLENLLFGGAIFGWPSLAYIYKDQGLFACDNNQMGQVENSTAGCPHQDRFLPLGLTVGLVGMGLGALAIGWMFDRYGLRITRTFTIVIGVIGSLCLALANRNHAYLIFPGTFLTGTASISIIATNHHVALLAGKRAPMFNLLYSGAINSAGIIYFLIKLAYDYGFSQQWSLLILTSLWILVALTTFLLLPRFKIQSKVDNQTKIPGGNVVNAQLEGSHTNKETKVGQSIPPLGDILGKQTLGATWTDLADNNYNTVEDNTKNGMIRQVLVNGHMKDSSCNGQTKSNMSDHLKHGNADIKLTATNDNSRHGLNDQQSLPVKSLWYYMFSFRFICHVVYFSLVHVWIVLVVAITNTWLANIYQGDTAQVSHYINIYAYVMFACGFLLSSFAGGLTNGVRHLLEGKSGGDVTTTARAMVVVPGLIMSSMAAILVAVFIMLEESWSVYPVFMFTQVSRGFLYGNVVSYIMLVFPMEHFGMLHGVMFAVTGATLAIQYGCVRWVEAAGYTPMVSFQLAMVVLSLLHPGIITTQYLREQRPKIISSP